MRRGRHARSRTRAGERPEVPYGLANISPHAALKIVLPFLMLLSFYYNSGYISYHYFEGGSRIIFAEGFHWTDPERPLPREIRRRIFSKSNADDDDGREMIYHDDGDFGKTRRRSSIRKKKDPRIIYFLHLHKAGGTSLCLAAEQNLGWDRVNGADNCNVQIDQRCCATVALATCHTTGTW